MLPADLGGKNRARTTLALRPQCAIFATVTWTTDQVIRRLFPEQSVTEYTDPTGEISFIERALPDSWVGRRVGGLEEGDRFRPVLVTRAGQARLVEVTLADESPAKGRPLSELDLPRDATIVAVIRQRRVVVPRGDTVLYPHDEVIALVTDESEEPVKALLVGD